MEVVTFFISVPYFKVLHCAPPVMSHYSLFVSFHFLSLDSERLKMHNC